MNFRASKTLSAVFLCGSFETNLSVFHILKITEEHISKARIEPVATISNNSFKNRTLISDLKK
ncbi:hypothetical protein C6A37_06705 [Desulfobacteraceae bacterium SEEP-SAG9]|nr:hypothetical protein C6A37_06705 [Desulfobacteraceae bacterium SEEP-SAG9]